MGHFAEAIALSGKFSDELYPGIFEQMLDVLIIDHEPIRLKLNKPPILDQIFKAS